MNKLKLEDKVKTTGPHGEYCGCKFFDEKGNKILYIGLGCKHPNNKLDIK